MRCQVCAKRWLLDVQGARQIAEARPSFIRLTARAKPRWEDPARGTADAKTAAPEDFHYGQALRYETFQA
eukprot:5884673-Prymnesium_polylepis.1